MRTPTAPPTRPELGWTAVYVDDVARSVELYQTAFGLELSFTHPAGDYAEFNTGATSLSMCSFELASQAADFDASRRTVPTGNITLVVTDVDEAFAAASSHGAQPKVSPHDKPWGQRCAMVSDTDGNLIELATRIAR